MQCTVQHYMKCSKCIALVLRMLMVVWWGLVEGNALMVRWLRHPPDPLLRIGGSIPTADAV